MIVSLSVDRSQQVSDKKKSNSKKTLTEQSQCLTLEAFMPDSTKKATTKTDTTDPMEDISTRKHFYNFN